MVAAVEHKTGIVLGQTEVDAGSNEIPAVRELSSRLDLAGRVVTLDVRDFTCDEDRCRAHVRHLPRNLACLTNVAIAIVRCDGRFRYLPEANRHYAARPQEALDAIMIAPTA